MEESSDETESLIDLVVVRVTSLFRIWLYNEHIHFMMKLTNDALAQMIVVVEKPEHQSIDINKSFNIENEINNYRNQLKNQNILDVNNKEYDYQMGVYYMDIIAECEKLGDYVVNVVEASSDVKEKRAS